MSYRTEYRLSVSKDGPVSGPSISEIAENLASRVKLNRKTQDQETWEAVIRGELDLDWEDHEEHIRMISGVWPENVFTLRGTGEDPGDQWVKYFRNRRVQRESQPRWSPPAFDPSQLR